MVNVWTRWHDRAVSLTFAGTLDHAAVIAAVDQLADLVGSAVVIDSWGQESALPGMTVGGLTRHLVSQPECAVEFLTSPVPVHAPLLTLVGHYDRVDWLRAPSDAPENISIRDDFNEMALAGPGECLQAFTQSREQLAAAIDVAGPVVYVPWQDCALSTDDFLVVRLMEIVVHADDLACSVDAMAPPFDAAVLEPVLALLAALALKRRGQDAVLRALSRNERATSSISAF